MPLCLRPSLSFPSSWAWLSLLFATAMVSPRPTWEAGLLHLLLRCVSVGLSVWPWGSLQHCIRRRKSSVIMGRDGLCHFLCELVPHLKKDVDCVFKSGLLSLV